MAIIYCITTCFTYSITVYLYQSRNRGYRVLRQSNTRGYKKPMKNSTSLYANEGLTDYLTAKTVKQAYAACAVKYFYDGNNGDKHLIVGHTMKGDEIDTVLAINISQCHVTGRYDCYKNANQLIADMKLPATGIELVHMFRAIHVWSY